MGATMRTARGLLRWVGIAAFSLPLGVKVLERILALIGFSTAPEDAMGLLDKLSSLPFWVAFMCAFGAWFVFVMWPLIERGWQKATSLGRMALTDAADLFYEKASDELRATTRRPLSNGTISSHAWCQALIVCAARDGIGTLYGKRDFGALSEQIPLNELALFGSHSDNAPKYLDIEIDYGDVLLMVEHYEKSLMNSINLRSSTSTSVAGRA